MDRSRSSSSSGLGESARPGATRESPSKFDLDLSHLELQSQADSEAAEGLTEALMGSSPL